MADAVTEEEDYEPTPWHFKLMLLGLVLYLIYRAYQLVEWLIHRYA
jgi:hypothetical protein